MYYNSVNARALGRLRPCIQSREKRTQGSKFHSNKARLKRAYSTRQRHTHEVLVAQWLCTCPHHCNSGSIPAPCSYLVKITLVTFEKSVVQFVSTKHRRFSPSTPVSSCSNTGSMRGGPYWTSKENSLCSG